MKKLLPALGLAAIVGFTGIAVVRLGQQPDGRFLVSNGQFVELLGVTNRIEGSRPKDMAPAPDGQTAALLSTRKVQIVSPNGQVLAEAAQAAAPLGIAWAPDGKTVYAVNSAGKVVAFAWDGKALVKGKEFDVLRAGTPGNPGTAGLAVGKDGVIYAALSIKNQIVCLNSDGSIKEFIDVEACPYHLRMSPDGKTLAYSSRGGTIVKPSPEQGDPNTGQPFQGTGTASANSAGTLVQVDARTDAALVGAIGIVTIGAGGIIKQLLPGGRQPSGICFSADGQTLYAANSDEDNLSIFDLKSKTQRKISLVPNDDPSFGQIPTDVAVSQDGKRIYVTLGGANAIAVLENEKVTGYIPTAWYPIALEAAGDQLLIGCAKGVGSRPEAKANGYGVHDNVGAWQVFGPKELSNPRAMTQRVARNNNWTKDLAPRKNRKAVPLPERIGEPSVIKHVVYIIKENLTYDVVFGAMKEGNGDPSLCTFPETVAPNHYALARRFGLLDNFYISGTNSADGHQWVASSIANGYTEQNYSANARSYPYDGGDPLAFSPNGFLWTQAKAAGKSVRVFGEFVDGPSVIDSKTGRSPSWQRCWDDYKSGAGEIIIKANTSQAALREHMHPTYIGFPSNVSDQWRADTFLKEVAEWEKTGKMPDLSIMLLPNDHTVGTRAGWPTPRAAVADNDRALGRIVEGLSRSKFWKDMVIIVAQDDSQLGRDHVDGHRSVGMVISPYSKRGETISDFYNHSSIISTISRVLGMPPLTRFDRTAKPMVACFGETPDLSPFRALRNNIPLDEVNPPAATLTGELKALTEVCNKFNWDELDTQDKGLVNRAVWAAEAPRSVGKLGFSTEFPKGK